MEYDPAADNPDYTIPDDAAAESESPADIRLPSDADGGMFQDLKPLGMGGMGVVYEADDPALERKVALKMLRARYRNQPEMIGKFIKEARITAKIDHPNIVAVHRLGMHPRCGAYFSMRRIQGETLQSIIRRLREGDPEARRRYTLRRLLNIFIACCNGVAAAHRKNILHCDLKPSNLMVGEIGAVWVMDWGLAREFGPDAPEQPASGSAGGTPAFMAPELLAGAQAVPDVKTDIYALGAILYCILAWRDAPFDLALPREKLLRAAAAGQVPPPRAPDQSQLVQVELAAICRKAMARDRGRRYASVAELLQDLHNYMDGYPVSAYSPNPVYRLLKFCRRRPLIPGVTVAALLVLALYHLGGAVLHYTENRAKVRQAYLSVRMAGDHLDQAFRIRRTLTGEMELPPLAVARAEGRMHLGVNLAMMETFAAFEAVRGLPPAAVEAFAANRGPQLGKRLLNAQILTAAPEVPGTTLARFENRVGRVFRRCVARDPGLRRLTDRIRERRGSLTLSAGATPVRGRVVRSDGQTEVLEFGEWRKLDLPAGDTKLFFTLPDGGTLAAFFRMSPGAATIFSLPDSGGAPGFVTVPADHWFQPVPGLGECLKLLPEYRIAAAEVTDAEFRRFVPAASRSGRPPSVRDKVLMTPEEARIFCRRLSAKLRRPVRIPGELELRKSLTPGDSPERSFYGAAPAERDLPLFIRRANGRIAVYDPVSGRIAAARPDTRAALRAVLPTM